MKKLLPLFAILALVGCGDNSAPKAETKTDTKVTSTTTSSTTKTATATNASAAPLNVTADELLKGYKENELAGDQKYKGKVIVITGKLDTIQSGFGDEPFITLKAGGDMEFNRPQAHFSKEQSADLAKLKKGAMIKIQCTGNGEIAGTPMLKDCKVI